MRHIELSQGQVALVDDQDYEWLAVYKWCAQYVSSTKSYYAGRRASGANGTKILMHRQILGLKSSDALQTDHINHNTLDNRRCNLRVVTNRENHQNRKKPGASKYPGVCWEKRRSKWHAQIFVGKKHFHLGYYVDELEAAQAYREAWAALTSDKDVVYANSF